MLSMQPLLTLYARKEPTTDPISIRHGLGGRRDSVFYRDRGCNEPVARWPWHYSSCPRFGKKRVTLNCYQWNVYWIA
jgi:hypothetical protein